jgi:hypothetical protein
MSKPPKTDFMALIHGEVAPAAKPAPEPQAAAPEPQPVVTLRPHSAPARKPAAGTLKERAHQLSVYLEPEVYDRLRDIAHEERTKLHSLVLEAIDLLLKRRGQPSIKELIKKSGSL